MSRLNGSQLSELTVLRAEVAELRKRGGDVLRALRAAQKQSALLSEMLSSILHRDYPDSVATVSKEDVIAAAMFAGCRLALVPDGTGSIAVRLVPYTKEELAALAAEKEKRDDDPDEPGSKLVVP